MIHLANILIADADAASAQELLRKVRSHGYDGRTVTSVEAVLSTVQQELPDIILVCSHLNGGDAFATAVALRAIPSCADIPICLLSDVRTADFRTRALDAGLDDSLAPPLDEGKLVARLRPLVRLSIMQAELRRRAAIAHSFGVEVSADIIRPATDSDYSVLLVGPSAIDLAPALTGARISQAADHFAANELLGNRNFDVALVAPMADPAPCLELCAQIRNNPRLFNLPVLFVGDAHRATEAPAYRHGASGYVALPVEPSELRAFALCQVRRQRLRWAIREALGRTLDVPTRDAATGVYRREFLDRYLPDRVNFAATHGRHLTILFFGVPDVEAIRRDFGEEQAEHLRLQVAQWITSLLRGEDLTVRYGENEFCVVLPDTPKDEAEIVMHRISGVLAYTDFAVKEVYQPVKVWVRAAAADLLPGDTVDSLVDRARREIL